MLPSGTRIGSGTDAGGGPALGHPHKGRTACALNAKAAQRAFELGYVCSDALEVLTREREQPHWRARHDAGRPLSREEECDLTERVAGAESLGRLPTVGQNIGAAPFDEIDSGSVVVERDDFGARFDLDLAHRGRELVELRRRKIGDQRNRRDPSVSTVADRATASNRLLLIAVRDRRERQ